MKKFLRKLILKEKSSSEEYIKYLRKKGMTIGERVTFFQPNQTTVDVQYPWMISIGDDVQITKGVVILTHGYDWSVTKKYKNHLMGNSGPVTIGSNVFIGINTIILPNVSIGNNVVIGAGSVVTRSIPDNSVAVGNPCHVIYDIDTYYEKLKNKQLEQAKQLGLTYYKKFNKIPPKDIFYDYFFLFEKYDSNYKENYSKKWIYELSLGDNLNSCLDYLRYNQSVYESYEEFLSEILEVNKLKYS